MTWVEETALTRPLDAARYETLIEAATQAGAAGDDDLHVNLLWLVARVLGGWIRVPKSDRP